MTLTRFLATTSLIGTVGAVMLALLTSCSPEPEQMPPDGPYGESKWGVNITYFADDRTGLCFAETGGVHDYSMTIVPCTEKVEAAIKWDKEP